MLRRAILTLSVGIFFAPQSVAGQGECSKFSIPSEFAGCASVMSTANRFFQLLRASMKEKAREVALHELYKERFARMRIAHTVVFKVHHRGVWEKVAGSVREKIAHLGGQFILKQIIYGRFGDAARSSNKVAVTIDRVEVRSRDIIVFSTVRGRKVVEVRWYLTKDHKVFNIYLSAPFPSYMLNTYTNHIARLASSHDRFILYKMKSKYPGEAVIKILKDLIKGDVELNPQPNQFR